MPVSIGDVQSEVLVEPSGEHGSGGQTRGAGGLPSPQEQLRWTQYRRQQQWDEKRTAAQDFDD